MSTNLKELLQKYNDQTATEAEIKKVKEQMEIFNLLQEQALIEEIPFNTLDTTDITYDAKQIKKQVNKKIIKITSLIFGSVLGFIVCFFLLIIPFMNRFYFNPETKEKNAPIPEFNLVSAVYTELTQPYLRLAYLTSEKTGLGTYQIEKGYSSVVSTNQNTYSNPRFSYSIKRGKPIFNQELIHPYLTMPLQQIAPNSDLEMYADYKQQKIEKLNDLPSSSQVNASFTFKKPLSIEETLAFLETDTYPTESNYRLNWLSVANEDLALGMDWFGTFQILEDKVGSNDPYLLSLNKKYPYLFPGAPTHQTISDQSNALESHFLSSLSYVVDNQNLLNMQESHYSINLLENVLKDTKKNGVQINGIYLSGTPQAVTTFASKEEVVAVDVQSAELYSDSFSDGKN